MRRCAAPARPATRLAGAFATALLLSGCHYASSPLVGFGGFIGDTHTFSTDPNRPPGEAENMQRASGRDFAVVPLLPEEGNVWPGAPPREPTLADVQQQQNQENERIDRSVPPTPAPRRPRRGSSTPPGSVQTAPEPAPNPAPFNGSSLGVQPPPTGVPPPAINTPQGTLIPNNSVGNSGTTTATQPGGGTSIVVPNGNGTSTVIGPDGSTHTIPAPR